MKLTAEQQRQLEALFEVVREHGLRKTRALDEVLRVLLLAPGPLSLGDLQADDGPLAGAYEMPTLSRLVNRLEQAGIVQKLGFRGRSAYYTLRLESRHHDYLICIECGRIEALEIACPVRDLEARIARKHRFVDVYHELEFYGRCPACG